MDHVKKLGKSIYSTASNITTSAYNMTPNIKALPDESHISNTASAVKKIPLVKDMYFNKFSTAERGFLETNFINDTTKINKVSDPTDKLFLKGVTKIGKINTQYDKIKSTPGVIEQYELYKSNSGGKRKRMRTKTKRHRRTGKKTKRNIKKRR